VRLPMRGQRTPQRRVRPGPARHRELPGMKSYPLRGDCSESNWGIGLHEMELEKIVPLRVLVTDGPGVRLDEVTRTIQGLGHDVIARESSLSDVARLTATEDPDVAVVIVHEGNDKALQLIDTIVREATCPVIAVLDVEDLAFIQEAAKRGIFAYIADGPGPREIQSSIDIVLRRFAEYHGLEGAFDRRAVTERAKGILMERHGVNEQAAFEMLRNQARSTSRKLVEIAEAVVVSRDMLPSGSPPKDVRDR
jgi:AmiR/NasT family two-component response regulator